MKATDHLSKEEIEGLVRPSDAQGWLAVGTTWAMIVGSLALVAYWPNVLTVVIALVILGGRHLALAILMHDCAHYSLFATRSLNEKVGAWLCAFPTWQDLSRYRGHHLRHHRYAGSAEDPDFDLVQPFPITRASLARKLLRDLSGLSGLKRAYGLLLMEFGYVEYTVSSRLKPARRVPFARRLSLGATNLRGLVLTNLVLLSVLWVCGQPWLYTLWIASWLTTYSAIVRIRSIAEHACTFMDPDPLQNTRTTDANWLARVTVAPHRVNYHLEHHLLPTVPYFRLKALHEKFRDHGALKGAFVSPGYLDVLRQAALLP